MGDGFGYAGSFADRHLPVMMTDPAHPMHGTNSGYAAGCKCVKCKQYHADYMRAWRHARGTTKMPRKPVPRIGIPAARGSA